MDMIGPLVRFPETYGRLQSIHLPVFNCPIAGLVAEDYIKIVKTKSIYVQKFKMPSVPVTSLQ
jgi:hypothetical protein